MSDNAEFPDGFFDFAPDDAIKPEIEVAKAAPKYGSRPKSGGPTGHNKPVRGGFGFIAVGDLELTSPEFLVDGLVETDSTAVMFGEPGCGKSFVAIGLACSVSTGSAFHGRAVKSGPVFYIAGEGHHGLARRFKAWESKNQMPLKGAPLFKSTCGAQFLDRDNAALVSKAANQLANIHGDPALIIIDTLARNYGPGDENSTADMSKFVAAMDKLRDQYARCVILIVHHSGHQEKERGRGSTALKAAADAEFVVVKEGNAIEVRCTKMKDADTPSDIRLQLCDVSLSGDGLIKSAALAEVEGGGSRMKTKAKPLSDVNGLYWSAILDFFSDPGFYKDIAPKRGMSKMKTALADMVRDHCFSAMGNVADNTSRSQWSRAKTALIAARKIGVWEDKLWLV